MTRRWFLLTTLLATNAASQSPDETLAVFAPLASALSGGDGEAFMKPFDRKMENYAKLRDNVLALLARYDVTSSIELNRVNGSDVELDWYLELHSKQAAGNSERRNQTVTARLEKKRIIFLEPVAFFRPTAS